MRRMVALLALSVGSLLALDPSSAAAEDKTKRDDAELETAPRSYVNLRAGVSSGDRNGRPHICGEVAPLAWLSVEGCGTGAGLWHDDGGQEMSHYRVNARLTSLRLGKGAAPWLEPRIGAGFSELQIAPDA